MNLTKRLYSISEATRYMSLSVQAMLRLIGEKILPGVVLPTEPVNRRFVQIDVKDMDRLMKKIVASPPKSFIEVQNEHEEEAHRQRILLDKKSAKDSYSWDYRFTAECPRRWWPD